MTFYNQFWARKALEPKGKRQPTDEGPLSPGTQRLPDPIQLPQRIPDEILLLVFEYLRPSFAYLSRLDIPHTAFEFQSEGTQCLIQTTCVCRSWQLVSTRTLYSRVLLRSQTKVELFARTLSTNPSLVTYILDVFILDFERYTKITVTLNAREGDNSTSWKTRIVSSMSRAVRETGLKSKTPSWLSRNLLAECFYRLGANPRLRSVTIMHPLWAKPPSRPIALTNIASISCLRVLCLRYIRKWNKHSRKELPSLPNLQVLHITLFVITTVEESPLVINHEKFPSLITLEIYGGHKSSINVSNSCLSHLRTFSFGGSFDFSTSLHNGLLHGRIRNVLFAGTDHGRSRGFKLMLTCLSVILSQLETVELYIRRRHNIPRNSRGAHSTASSDLPILECLYNGVSHHKPECLRRVEIFVEPRTVVNGDRTSTRSIDEAIDSQIEELAISCLGHGISFEKTDQKLDVWIRNRLEMTLTKMPLIW